MVIDANEQGATSVAQYLAGELKPAFEGATLGVSKGGFSHFIISGECEAFFEL